MLPTVQQTGSGNNNANSTTHTVTMPSTVNRGDLLLVVLASDGAPTHGAPAGWQQIGTTDVNGTAVSMSVWGKMAAGDEASDALSFTTSASERTAHVVYRVSGWIGTVADIKLGTAATGASTTPDPPTLNPPDYATDDFLWIPIAAWDGNVSTSSTDFGTGGYTVTTNRAANTAGCGVAAGVLAENNSSKNPGTITLSGSDDWVANLIAVPGARVIFYENFENNGSAPADGTAMSSSNTLFDLFNGTAPNERTFESTTPVPNSGRKRGNYHVEGSGQAVTKDTTTLPGPTNGGVAYESLVLSAYFRTGDSFGIDNRVMVIEESVSAGGDDIAVVRIDSTGEVNFLDGTTVRTPAGTHTIPGHTHWHRLDLWVDQQRDYWQIRHWWGADADSMSTGATNYEEISGTDFTSALGMEVWGIGSYGGVTADLGVDDVTVFAGAYQDFPGPTLTTYADAGVATGSGTAHQPTISTSGGSATNANAGVATGSGTANQPTITRTGNPQAQVATGSGVANQPTITRTGRPQAQVATATGTAQQPTIRVAPSVGVATATGVANAPSRSIRVSAGVATGSGTANNATVTSGTIASAGVATGTGTANQPTITRTGNANAGLASATGTAHQPTITRSTNVTAGVATGSGTANPSTIRIAPSVGVASATGTALAPSRSIRTSAGVATGSGVAQQPTVTRQGRPTPTAATGSGVAQQPTIRVAPSVQVATSVGTAYNAGVTTSGAGSAVANPALGTATAHQPTIRVAPTAGLASATGAALQPTVTRTGRANAGVATATGTANTPSRSIRPTAGSAAGTGAALNATVSVGGNTQAMAGVAAATGVAYAPGGSVAPTAGVALVTVVVNPTGHAISVGAQVATATAVAYAPTIGEPLADYYRLIMPQRTPGKVNRKGFTKYLDRVATPYSIVIEDGVARSVVNPSAGLDPSTVFLGGHEYLLALGDPRIAILEAAGYELEAVT